MWILQSKTLQHHLPAIHPWCVFSLLLFTNPLHAHHSQLTPFPSFALLQPSSQEIYDLFFFGWSPFCFGRIELLSLPSNLKQVSQASWHWHGGKSHLHSAITEMWSEAGDTLELLSLSTFELRSQATFSALAATVSHGVWHDCAESKNKKKVYIWVFLPLSCFSLSFWALSLSFSTHLSSVSSSFLPVETGKSRIILCKCL